MSEIIIGPLASALNTVWLATLSVLPNLIAAIIILIIGFIVGKIVGAVVEEILLKFKVDDYVHSRKAEFKLSHIFSVVFRWVLYLVFIQQAAAALNISVISTFIGNVVVFLPGIIGAIIVIATGYALGRYIEDLIEDSAAVYAGIMSRVFFFFIVYISVAIALPLVGLDPSLVNNILLIVIGSIGVGTAIALGLGMKDTVADLSKEFGKKLLAQLRKK